MFETPDDVKSLDVAHSYLYYQINPNQIGCNFIVGFSGQKYKGNDGIQLENVILIEDMTNFRNISAIHEITHQFSTDALNDLNGFALVKSIMAIDYLCLFSAKTPFWIDIANIKRIKDAKFEMKYDEERFDKLKEWLAENKNDVEDVKKLYFLNSVNYSLCKEDYLLGKKIYDKLIKKYKNDEFIKSLAITKNKSDIRGKIKKINLPIILHYNRAIELHYNGKYREAMMEVDYALKLARVSGDKFIINEIALARKYYEDLRFKDLHFSNK